MKNKENVSLFTNQLSLNDSFINKLQCEVDTFQSGSIAKCLTAWVKLTADPFLLDIVHSGLKIEFCDYPYTEKEGQTQVAAGKGMGIKHEIEKLMLKKVIDKCGREPNDFISPIFTRPRKDGSIRLILNLKELNTHIEHLHFKMETLTSVLNLIKPNVYMASVDLKDAFYTIPVHPAHQIFLKFIYENQIYKFFCMPNGYRDAMRIFTKILKPPFSHLRSRGHTSIVYVDDTYLQSDSYEQCCTNIEDTVNLLRSLGFTIHPKKSILIPTQVIEFLGFVLNSRNMTISVSPPKAGSVIDKIKKFISNNSNTLRDLASVLGTIISVIPATPYGKLHYRTTEKFKILELKKAKGNFNAKLSLISEDVNAELYWRIVNVGKHHQPICQPEIDLHLETDASLEGWGATDHHTPIGGSWHNTEGHSINYLEMMAILLAIKSYTRAKTNIKHIRILCDNMTAVSYVNNMGGSRSGNCNDIAKLIWDYCRGKNMWISAAHIPGKANQIADKMSRQFNDNTEWKLCPIIYQEICKILSFSPDIDLFAFWINNQVQKYISWKQDPGSIAIDAFSISWSKSDFYAFPPFSIIGSVIRKIIHDGATGIIITPLWPTQYWFPQLGDHIIHAPVLLPKKKNLLSLPNNKTHPLFPNLQLVAMLISGNPWKVRDFQQKLKTSSLNHGDQQQCKNTTQYSKDGIHGNYFVAKGMRILMHQL